MPSASPSPARPRSPADVRPTVLQAVLTFAGGIVLAAGSCAGFLATLNFNRDSAINAAFAIGFMLSLVVAAAGVCLIVIRQFLVMRLRRAAALATARPPVQSAASGATIGTRPAGAALPVTDQGTAWMSFVIAALLMLTAVGAVVLLVVTDPNPIAILFLVLAAAAAVGSLVFFVIAAVRYSRGR